MVTRKLPVWLLLLLIAERNVTAGPLPRSNRLAREIYPEIDPSETDGTQTQVCVVGDVVYGVDEPVPAEQPCLKCRCQPPGIQCDAIKCVKRPGCKAIHRPNKCCPDYQCECHHEGKSFANGERLKTLPGGECKVCYCRGGEVQCADVSCYIRTDCEAKTVPGQCCPKYDHCPPKEPLFGRANSAPPNQTLPEVNPDLLELWPLSKLLNTSEDTNKIEVTKPEVTTRRQIEEPKITIQEIIPEIKEIAVTASSRQDLINDLIDAEPDSSEITEVFQQPPPSVLRIGDKLLFLKQGGEMVNEKDASTPTSIITIIGAEGLQRGFEESAEATLLFNNSNDLEPKTSESTHIISLLRPAKKIEETTPEVKMVIKDENPAYPPIPDVMSHDRTSEAKIIPEVLESVNRTGNITQWLKSTPPEDTLVNLRAILPAEILNATAPSDLLDEEILNRSVEIPEEDTTEESGEETTPATNHSSIIDASVEPSEMDDMVKDVEIILMPDIFNQTEENSTTPEDVELLPTTSPTPLMEVTNNEDVEIIRNLSKREASNEDDIFKELSYELNADSTERIQTAEEETSESDRIFRELLEETSTPKSTKKLDKDAQTLQRVSDAIAKLTLRGGKNSFDPSILGVITDFFGSQYKAK